VIGHKGKEFLNVFRWDGEGMTSLLRLSGRFLFEGSWMEDVFAEYTPIPGRLVIGELQQHAAASKHTWILRGYRWDGEILQLEIIQRVDLPGGG
jgi:hypothetical protein